jgi:hypothetical protein
VKRDNVFMSFPEKLNHEYNIIIVEQGINRAK